MRETTGQATVIIINQIIKYYNVRCRAGSEGEDEQRHCIWSESRRSCVPALGRVTVRESEKKMEKVRF